jgi:hypothetical protein
MNNTFRDNNTFRTSNETLFLVNILNTMYNDNLRQINNLIDTLNNLNTSNNQIRTLLTQLINGHQNTGRNRSRRFDNNNNYDHNLLTNSFGGRGIDYLVAEYTIPRTNSVNNINPLREQYTTELLRNAQSIFENFFQPIEIYPTQDQIETATRRVRYCDISRPVNISCPISMDEFSDNDMVTVIRHCGHIFHTENIMNWFRSNCRCPVCRYDIREFNSNVSNRFFNNAQDTSNNNVERNNNNNNNNTLLNQEYTSNIVPSSLQTLLQSSILDNSGNNTTTPTDILTSFLIQTLNRGRNTR